ncbi:MAG: Crp/Fnr family transcriptional regulator [Firmicutes bacterium]|nr:Crp/Fnr family transcriptional regulator [Bacillota bacterium]
MYVTYVTKRNGVYFMDKIINILNQSFLFKNIDNKELKEILDKLNYTVNEYKKNEIVAIEGNECTNLGLLVDGILDIQSIYPSGKILTLVQIKSPDVFGEVVLFSKTNKYPATIKATNDSKVMFIEKKNFINLLTTHPKVLENFMSNMSNKLLHLNGKVKMLSLETIRQKISDFLIKEYKKQKSYMINIPFSRKEMADYLDIQRPSLSRELAKMKKENLIDFDKNTFKIKDLEGLEECFF